MWTNLIFIYLKPMWKIEHNTRFDIWDIVYWWDWHTISKHFTWMEEFDIKYVKFARRWEIRDIVIEKDYFYYIVNYVNNSHCETMENELFTSDEIISYIEDNNEKYIDCLKKHLA